MGGPTTKFLYYFLHSNQCSTPAVGVVMRSSTPSTSKNGFDSAMYGHTLITNGGLAYIMDPIHYAKIADQLMQFRGKLPKEPHLELKAAKYATENLKERIDTLLVAIDLFAGKDEYGWIK